jgi:hypothetical protein
MSSVMGTERTKLIAQSASVCPTAVSSTDREVQAVDVTDAG